MRWRGDNGRIIRIIEQIIKNGKATRRVAMRAHKRGDNAMVRYKIKKVEN